MVLVKAASDLDLLCEKKRPFVWLQRSHLFAFDLIRFALWRALIIIRGSLAKPEIDQVIQLTSCNPHQFQRYQSVVFLISSLWLSRQRDFPHITSRNTPHLRYRAITRPTVQIPRPITYPPPPPPTLIPQKSPPSHLPSSAPLADSKC